MSKNRIKIKLPQISTRDEAEMAVGEIALAIINKTNLTAQMDKEIAEATFPPSMPMLPPRPRRCAFGPRQTRKHFPKDASPWSSFRARLDSARARRRSRLLNRKWNWEKVVDALQHRLPAFLRDKPEVDKAALLAQRDEPVIRENLPLVGLKVTQDEGFFVEPKLTKVETRQVVDSAKAA